MPWKRKLKDKRAMRGLWSYSLLSIYLYKSFITSSVTHMYVFNSLLQFPIPFLRYNQRHFKMILLNPKWQKVTWHESLTWMNFQFKHNAFQFSSVAQSCPTLCNPLDHARPPCPSPPPGVYSNSCPLSPWYHSTISSLCRPLLLPPSIFPSIRVFSNESALPIRWPKYWSFSFSISPSNEYLGLQP